MIALWPDMRRGFEATVPIVPGFVNEIVVPEEQKKWAKIALDRMLSIK